MQNEAITNKGSTHPAAIGTSAESWDEESG
jgi:hypothetical protein